MSSPVPFNRTEDENLSLAAYGCDLRGVSAGGGLHIGTSLWRELHSLFQSVHALVGDAEQLDGVVGIVGIDGHAHARGDLHGLPFDEDGPFEGAAHRFHEVVERLIDVEVGGDNDELIAAEA